MLRFFNILFFYILLLPVLSNGQQLQGVRYNLQQNWVQYNREKESFIPVVAKSSGSAISFKMDGKKYHQQKIFIKNSNDIYLFHKKKLLAKLKSGSHLLAIDSLLLITNIPNPIFSLYGKNIKKNLITLIVDNSFQGLGTSAKEKYFKNKSFATFFIITSLLLLTGLTLIKLNLPKLYTQYTNISRTFSQITINNENFYKGNFFTNPNVNMINWMSFSAAFVLHFITTQQNIQLIEVDWLEASTLLFHIVHLLVLTFGFFLFFIIKYLIISFMAFVFDLTSIKNIHFGTYLRFIFYLLLLLQTIIILAYFLILPITISHILVIVFAILFATIVLIGIRLTLLTKHPFVQIFLYLCSTEILLFISVLKMVVG